MTRKEIVNALSEIAAPDDIKVHKSGWIEVRRNYFYGMGKGQGFVNEVAAALPQFTFTYRDDFRQWPKESYYVAVGMPKQITKAVEAA